MGSTDQVSGVLSIADNSECVSGCGNTHRTTGFPRQFGPILCQYLLTFLLFCFRKFVASTMLPFCITIGSMTFFLVASPKSPELSISETCTKYWPSAHYCEGYGSHLVAYVWTALSLRLTSGNITPLYIYRFPNSGAPPPRGCWPCWGRKLFVRGTDLFWTICGLKIKYIFW
jgi:hypothetical protein